MCPISWKEPADLQTGEPDDAPREGEQGRVFEAKTGGISGMTPEYLVQRCRPRR